jgi:alkylation response protein AidB-like acyl-CoA dehydrogenase
MLVIMPSQAQADLHRPASPDPIAKARRLAAIFRQRAAENDALGRFPHANFDDLAQEGLMASAVPRIFGGGGLSMANNDPLPQWLITAAVASGDLSTARVYEAHVNSIDMIAALGSDQLQRDIFPDVVAGKVQLSAWLSEPSVVEIQDGAQRFAGGTSARPADGGWYVSGTKTYASGAGRATHAMIAATVVDGPTVAAPRQIWLLLDASASGVTIDLEGWLPMGMRPSASGRVVLDNVFIPERRRLADMRDAVAWFGQARILPQFAASFIGGATAAYEFTRAYIQRRKKQDDPFVQHHIGQMRVALEVANGFLERTARAWLEDEPAEAALISNMCRVVAEQQCAAVLGHATHACGSTALIEPNPLGRIWRDLQMYMRHENLDRTVATIGRAAIGVAYDPNFARIS